jgi:hypothetical protein
MITLTVNGRNWVLCFRPVSGIQPDWSTFVNIYRPIWFSWSRHFAGMRLLWMYSSVSSSALAKRVLVSGTWSHNGAVCCNTIYIYALYLFLFHPKLSLPNLCGKVHFHDLKYYRVSEVRWQRFEKHRTPSPYLFVDASRNWGDQVSPKSCEKDQEWLRLNKSAWIRKLTESEGSSGWVGCDCELRSGAQRPFAEKEYLLWNASVKYSAGCVNETTEENSAVAYSEVVVNQDLKRLCDRYELFRTKINVTKLWARTPIGNVPNFEHTRAWLTSQRINS